MNLAMTTVRGLVFRLRVDRDGTSERENTLDLHLWIHFVEYSTDHHTEHKSDDCGQSQTIARETYEDESEIG